MKRLRNSTPIPDTVIQDVERFVCPSGVRGYDLEVRNCADNDMAGSAHYRGSSYHSTARPFVVCRIGAQRRFAIERTEQVGRDTVYHVAEAAPIETAEEHAGNALQIMRELRELGRKPTGEEFLTVATRLQRALAEWVRENGPENGPNPAHLD